MRIPCAGSHMILTIISPVNLPHDRDWRANDTLRNQCATPRRMSNAYIFFYRFFVKMILSIFGMSIFTEKIRFLYSTVYYQSPLPLRRFYSFSLSVLLIQKYTFVQGWK